MKNRKKGVPIRIWIPGCSTGEEAYSVAISLLQFLGESSIHTPIQIFASDISEPAIQKARTGEYLKSIECDVSADLLDHFFVRLEDGGYKIIQSIRDICFFSRHDLASNQPFSKIDLICCRNLLIYFSPILQKHIIPIFHYSLNKDGVLWLGRSEAIGEASHFFSVLDKANKIYLRKNVPIALNLKFPISTYVPEKQEYVYKPIDLKIKKLEIQKAADQIIPASKGRVKPSGKDKMSAKRKGKNIIQLQDELVSIQEAHHFLTTKYEATQNDLTASNEELQSGNEELKSINEELETAKEELQSGNEELTTVNDELHNRIIEQSQLNNDLINFVGSVDIPIIMVGRDRRIRRFTHKAGKILNLIPGDVGRPIGDIKQNFDVPDLDHSISEVIESMQSQQIELQDRQGRWHRLQIKPYKTVENKIDGAVVVFMDIDALKQSLTNTKAALDYMTSVAATVTIPLVVLDSKFRLRSANPSFYEYFKSTSSDLGTNIFSIFNKSKDQSNFSELANLLSKALTNNVPFNNFKLSYESPLLGKRVILLNGRQINWIEADDPQSQSILLAIEDVTLRNQLDQVNATLLFNEQSARMVADKANRTKDLFLATLSHELRTPLTAILSWTQMLRMENVSEEHIKQGLETIEENAIIQERLINDLLDISIVHAGKLQLEIHEIDPCVVLNAALKSVRFQAKVKSIQFETKYDRVEKKFFADFTRLQQVFWNLFTNAIKFSPEKSKITVHLEQIEVSSEKYLQIKVSDQGKGISPEFLPHIFDRFTQADTSTTRAHSGLGLGLAIVRDLIALHKGTVIAESPGVGRGSTFTVRLPFMSPSLVKSTMPQVQNRGKDRPNLNDLRVLLVDDDGDSRQGLAISLTSFGAQVKTASSVSAALEDQRQFIPDVVISDIAMPGEDGYDLIQKIRALKPNEGGQVPCIALTAYAGTENAELTLSIGFQAYLAKPIDVYRLAEVIAQVVGLKHESSIDLSFLEQLRSMGPPSEPDIVQTVVRIFLANSPGTLNIIEQAFKNKDYEKAARAAHALKSSSANIGARRLMSLLDRFEFFDEKISQDNRHELLGYIQKEYKKVQEILGDS